MIVHINGSATSTINQCFSLLNSLKGSSLPKQMIYLGRKVEGSEIPNVFNEFFTNNFNHDSHVTTVLSYCNDIKLESFIDFISVSTIFDLVTKTKISTVSTFDNFPCKLLEMSPHLFSQLIYPQFCSIILTQVFPSIWKVGRITPFFISRCRNSINCYRPISLLPKASLVFEKILFNFIYPQLRDKLQPKQFGFQSRKSAFSNFLII